MNKRSSSVKLSLVKNPQFPSLALHKKKMLDQVLTYLSTRYAELLVSQTLPTFYDPHRMYLTTKGYHLVAGH